MAEPDQPEPVRRVAIATSHPWGVPHPVNDHVAELAAGLCDLAQAGEPAPEVVVVAPSLDPRARRATRRALREIARGDDVSGVLLDDELRASVPGARNSEPALDFPLLALGVPVGRASVAQRASLRLIMERGGIDILNVHDPLDSGLTRFMVRHWPGLTVATFHAAPAPGLLDVVAAALRERLVEQVDRWLLAGPQVDHDLQALGLEVPDDAVRIPVLASGLGVDVASHGEGRERLVVIGRGESDDAQVLELMRALEPIADALPDARIAMLSRWTDHHRPLEGRTWRGRIDDVLALTREDSMQLLASAATFIALPGTPARLELEARASGLRLLRYEPEAAGAGLVDAVRHDLEAGSAGLEVAAGSEVAASRSDLAAAHLAAFAEVVERRQVHIAPPALAERTCAIDLHMHTSHSWDCATDPEALLYVARKVGLTAVAVTDHNEISGAQACAELGPEYGIQVIVGEEVKTAEGEVIGLFLTERIEPGLSWVETIERIRAQDGLVYVPHPFDRLHTIPDIATLRETVDEIDAFEVWNARLAFEQYNRDAQRFARKYNLLEGAGSDAHVVQGLGTAAVHMPAWDDPESFLTALGRGEIIRRPKSLLYLQGLKWINDLTGKSKQPPVEREAGAHDGRG